MYFLKILFIPIVDLIFYLDRIIDKFNLYFELDQNNNNLKSDIS